MAFRGARLVVHNLRLGTFANSDALDFDLLPNTELPIHGNGNPMAAHVHGVTYFSEILATLTNAQEANRQFQRYSLTGAQVFVTVGQRGLSLEGQFLGFIVEIRKVAPPSNSQK